MVIAVEMACILLAVVAYRCPVVSAQVDVVGQHGVDCLVSAVHLGSHPSQFVGISDFVVSLHVFIGRVGTFCCRHLIWFTGVALPSIGRSRQL